MHLEKVAEAAQKARDCCHEIQHQVHLLAARLGLGRVAGSEMERIDSLVGFMLMAIDELEKLKLTGRPLGKRTKLKEGVIAQIRQWVAEGRPVSATALCKKLRISRETMYAWLREHPPAPEPWPDREVLIAMETSDFVSFLKVNKLEEIAFLLDSPGMYGPGSPDRIDLVDWILMRKPNER